MNGIRCVLLNADGLVVNYFLADPANGAIDAGADKNGLFCIPHDLAFVGDTIIDGVWTQSPENLAISQSDAP